MSLAHNLVAIDLRVNDLTDDESVRETDHKTILGRLILVLGLNNETLSLTVVSLSLTTTAELDLVPGKIGLVLLNLNESLREGKK